MNPIKKTYCLVFQSAFRIALPFLPFRNPKRLGSIDDIPALLKQKHCCRPLIVTDKSLYEMGMITHLENILDKAGIFYAVYKDTVANPTSVNVMQATSLYKMDNCNCIIGFGGGSSMDCAKAVGASIARPGTSLARLEGTMKVIARPPLTIAIPTTAGTGSETTVTAVITDSVTRHKYTINDFPLIPGYAVLDPKVTVSLPKSITSTTGMDALTHAVEAYIGNYETPVTSKYALKAVSLIFRYLDRAYENGEDIVAREKMLAASYYAGCAFTRSCVGYVHAVAHSLGGEYNIPHGLANAIILPFVLEEYGSSIYHKLAKLAKAAGLEVEGLNDAEAAKAFINAIKDMKKRFGIGDTIPEIQEKDVPKLAGYADHEANPLYPVPVLMDAGELEKFYYMLMPAQE